MTGAVEKWKKDLDARLHKKNAFTDCLEMLEKKTGVRRLYLLLGMYVTTYFFFLGYTDITAVFFVQVVPTTAAHLDTFICSFFQVFQ